VITAFDAGGGIGLSARTGIAATVRAVVNTAHVNCRGCSM
jgi:hypothetical protein